MGKKNFPNKIEVFSFIDTLKNVNDKKEVISELIKKYHAFTKTSANVYHILYKKSRNTLEETNVKTNVKEKYEPIINRIEIDDTMEYIVNNSMKDEYEVIEIKLIPMIFKGNKYYYDALSKKIYDLEFNFLETLS